MVVPDLPARIIHVDIAHARFDKAPRQQAAVAECARAVFLANVLGLFANVEQLQRLELHAVGRLHRFDAPLEELIGAKRLRVGLVQLEQRVHIGALRVFVDKLVAQIGDDLSGSGSATANPTP